MRHINIYRECLGWWFIFFSYSCIMHFTGIEKNWWILQQYFVTQNYSTDHIPIFIFDIFWLKKDGKLYLFPLQQFMYVQILTTHCRTLFNLCAYTSAVMKLCLPKNSYPLFSKYPVSYKIEDKDKWLIFSIKIFIVFS